MKKKFGFWAVFTLAAVAAIASVPLMQTAPTKLQWAAPINYTYTNPNSDAVPLGFNLSENGRDERNPLDIQDSTMFTDDMEGSHPAWTSLDLAAGYYWHVEAFNGFGTNSNVLQCSQPLSGVCDTANGGYNNHWLQYLVLDAVDLSSATSPTFSFTANWRIEPLSGGYPAGFDSWDGWNVWGSADGGSTWSVLTPTSPAYNCASNFAFGDEWGMGTGIAAYSDSSAGPVTCTFSLASLIGNSNVKVRVAFCSDPAASSIDGQIGCNRFGLMVDDLLIQDGSSTLYSNNGTGTGWTNEGGPVSPDTWSYDNSTSNSPTHSYTGGVASNLSRGLTSYDVILPSGYQQLGLDYYVWCDMPDYEGPDTDNFLEDYYQIFVTSNNGVSWTQTHYDYANTVDGCNSLTNWCHRTTALVSGQGYQPIIVFQRTTAPDNETLRVAFQLITDNNDDGGGPGTGVHIDDVTFHAIRAQNRDLSTNNIVVPYPNTVGIQKQWSVRVSNEGLLAVSPVRYTLRYFRPGGTTLPPGATDSTVVISGALNYQEDTLSFRVWTPDSAGAWRVRTKANLTGEEDRTNDTAYTPINQTQNDDSTLAVYVRSAGTYELGYGRRAVASAYLNQRFFHVTPVADNVPAADADTGEVYQVRVMWRYDAELGSIGGRVRLNFFSEGADTFHVGTLLASFTTNVDTSETIGEGGFIHWWEYTLPCPVVVNGNFWWSIAQLDTFMIDGAPQAAPLTLGTSAAIPGISSNDGHTYFGDTSVNGGALTQSGGRILANVMYRAATPLGAPTAVVVNRSTGPGNNTVLNWAAVSGACSYNVYRSTNFGAPVFLANVATNNFVDVGAVASNRNFYVVRAVK